jgi:thiol-disulfide isomerase/thioredoxin
MPRKRRPKNSNLSRFLIVAVLVLLVAVVLIVKEKPQAAAVSGEIADAQLERALEAGQPTLAFYHSNNCKSCIEMIGIVQQVYPEFSGSVALVDVNVYADENRPLLQKQQIQYIPTLVFYDQQGTREVFVGVMETETLRVKLETIRGSQ